MKPGILIGAAILFVATSTPLAVSFAISPDDLDSGRMTLTPPCPYRAQHGRPCVACGLSRAFAALSHGRLSDAQRFNPASPHAYGAAWLLAGVSASALGVGLLRRNRSHEPSRD